MCNLTEDTLSVRGPYTYESGSRVRLGSGSNEPNSSVCGSPLSYVCNELNPSPAPRRAGLASQSPTCMGRLSLNFPPAYNRGKENTFEIKFSDFIMVTTHYTITDGEANFLRSLLSIPQMNYTVRLKLL
jgi:hypothetical protein